MARKKDLYEDAEQWFNKNFGFMPQSDQLEEWFKVEPGAAELLHCILDPVHHQNKRVRESEAYKKKGKSNGKNKSK